MNYDCIPSRKCRGGRGGGGGFKVKKNQSTSSCKELNGGQRRFLFFIILPKESGKSVCISVLPVAFDFLFVHVGSIYIVVSPLIALMKDQVCNNLLFRLTYMYYQTVLLYRYRLHL